MGDVLIGGKPTGMYFFPSLFKYFFTIQETYVYILLSTVFQDTVDTVAQPLQILALPYSPVQLYVFAWWWSMDHNDSDLRIIDSPSFFLCLLDCGDYDKPRNRSLRSC